MAEGGTFALSMADVEARLSTAAITANDAVPYDPAETRVARLGTFAVSLRDRQSRFAEGFEEPSGDGLLLLFVDRRCRIHGSVTLLDGSRRVDVDLTLPHAGVHWIGFDDRTPGLRKLFRATPDGRIAYVLKEQARAAAGQ